MISPSQQIVYNINKAATLICYRQVLRHSDRSAVGTLFTYRLCNLIYM